MFVQMAEVPSNARVGFNETAENTEGTWAVSRIVVAGRYNATIEGTREGLVGNANSIV